MTSATDTSIKATILFDGVCNLCNASVRFIINRDARQRFQFAALQSSIGQQLLAEHNVAPNSLDSVLLIEEQQIYRESTAALRIAKQLDGLWPLLGVLLWIPSGLRDWGYRFIGKRRYQLFGKRQHCMIPSDKLRQRFLAEQPNNTNAP